MKNEAVLKAAEEVANRSYEARDLEGVHESLIEARNVIFALKAQIYSLEGDLRVAELQQKFTEARLEAARAEVEFWKDAAVK